MNNLDRAILQHAQPPPRRGYRARVVNEVKMREPATDIADRSNYACTACGRAWRKRGENWRCPYCGYYEEAK